jgi:hypothetical protein
MPIYCYCCPKCDVHCDVSKTMRNAGRTERCPECRSRMERDYSSEKKFGVVDPDDWSRDNGGRGRRNPQLDAESGDQTYFRSKREMVSYLKGRHTDKVGSQGRTLIVND